MVHDVTSSMSRDLDHVTDLVTGGSRLRPIGGQISPEFPLNPRNPQFSVRLHLISLRLIVTSHCANSPREVDPIIRAVIPISGHYIQPLSTT